MTLTSFKRILTHLYVGKISHLEALAQFQDLFDSGFVIDINLDSCKVLIANAFEESKIYELFLSNGLHLREIVRYDKYNKSNAEDMAKLLLSKGCSLYDIIQCVHYRQKVGSIIQILLSNGIALEEITEIIVESQLFNNPELMAALLRENPSNLDLEGEFLQNPEVRAMLFNRGMYWSEMIPIWQEVMEAQQKVRELELELAENQGKLFGNKLQQLKDELTDARNDKHLRLYADKLKRWKIRFNFALEENIAEVQMILDKTFSIDSVTD